MFRLIKRLNPVPFPNSPLVKTHLHIYFIFCYEAKHNNWFIRIFSYPVVVKDLLLSFVHEDFVKDLEFKSLKKTEL